jgi:hypothetical protein
VRFALWVGITFVKLQMAANRRKLRFGFSTIRGDAVRALAAAGDLGHDDALLVTRIKESKKTRNQQRR